MGHKKTGYENVGCIGLDQSDINWWVPVNAVISSGVLHLVMSLLDQPNACYVLKKESI